jgi:DME family drug/metabolite transporter
MLPLSSSLAGVFAVLLAASLWGTTGTIQALLPVGRDPIAVAVFRLGIGSLALLLFCAVNPDSRAGFKRLPRGLAVFAGLAIGLYNLFFFSAVSLAGVGVGTAIAIGSGPIWVSLFEVTFRRMRPSRAQLIGQAICITGAIALVASNDSAAIGWIGYFLAALAGMAYASYSITTNKVSETIPSGTTAAATFTVAAVFSAPFLLLADASWVVTGTLPPLLFLGIFSTGIAFYLFTFGVRTMTSSSAVTLALAEPLTAWLLATFALREELSGLKILGAVLLLIGLWIAARSLPPRTFPPR